MKCKRCGYDNSSNKISFLTSLVFGLMTLGISLMIQVISSAFNSSSESSYNQKCQNCGSKL